MLQNQMKKSGFCYFVMLSTLDIDLKQTLIQFRSLHASLTLPDPVIFKGNTQSVAES